MSARLKKALEIVFVIAVIALSVVIFIFRDRIGDIGALGYPGLFLLCLISNASILLPAPSLMVAASCALIMNPVLVALVAALGSTCGELIGYAAGRAGQDVSPRFKGLLGRTVGRIKNPLLLVFILALLPLPLFDLIGLYSGGVRMSIPRFFAACFAGKAIKMLIFVHLIPLAEFAARRMDVPYIDEIRERLGGKGRV